MSVELNTNNTVPMSTETILAVKSANLSKSQTELEGQMALALIESASVGNESLAVVGNIGQNINIKA
tara:strand:- start:212 stop:412 length:201 start_codon:yes stop_codon:yes gene_type:complete